MHPSIKLLAVPLLMVLLWLPGSLSAQATQLRGRTVDAEANPLAYATVTVYQLPDSTPAGGALTDEQGAFSIPLKAGQYALQIKILSFSQKNIANLTVPKAGLDLGNIPLTTSDVALDGVKIQANANQMVLKLDKRVFNVGTDLSNTARNAAEILDNVPSVTVDMDGNVALRGSQNVRILIDGKPSGLVNNGTDALRQLPGNLIESVEVITNPSSRYDAEGEVGILNVVLKKEKRRGINGVFELTGGIPHNHRASYSLNLRKKAFNLFSSYAVTYRESPGSGSSFQTFDLGDTSFAYARTRSHVRGGWGHALSAGSDFFLGKRTTLTVSGLYQNSRGNNLATLDYADFNFENVNTQNVQRTDDEIETRHVIESAVSFVQTFAQKDRKWTIDMKFVNSDDTETSNILERSDAGIADLYQRSSNEEDERTLFFQSDYVHPFAKDGRFEVGYRGNIRRIQNAYFVEEQQPDASWSLLEGFNNDFIYLENIHAAYLQAANKTGKLSYQAGLRAEYTDISTELLVTGETNPRNYLNLFPSTSLSYAITPTKTLQFSYSRRLSRPRFRNLLPFTSFSDNRNFRAGNPDLDPEFTHSLETGYLQYFKKGSLLSSVYYRRTTGLMQRITLPDSTGFTLRIPVNIGYQDAYGVEFNLSLRPAKWWKLNSNFNFFRQLIFGEYEGQSLDADALTWSTRLTSKMTLWNQLEFQATFDYRGPENQPQGRRQSVYFLDLGFSKDILRKKATIALTGRDIFNSRRWRWSVTEEGYDMESDFQWRARQIQATFTYRLNQEKQRPRRNGPGGNSGTSGF